MTVTLSYEELCAYHGKNAVYNNSSKLHHGKISVNGLNRRIFFVSNTLEGLTDRDLDMMGYSKSYLLGGSTDYYIIFGTGGLVELEGLKDIRPLYVKLFNSSE